MDAVEADSECAVVQSNIIVNGTFELGNSGWGGTDLETNYDETAYLGNGSKNDVAEMDGVTGKTTVMTQTVKIGGAQTTDLMFRTALRTASTSNAGTEGFRVDIVDSSGTVIATQTFFPTTTAWTTNSMPVTFPEAGAYTIRMTELGKDDSLGAIIDDVSMLVCFVAGTLIDTATGPRPVETLACGDLVWTMDHGLQPVRWTGQRRISQPELIANETLRPILFAKGALGPELPDRTLAVSPQHRVYRGDWQTEFYFGHPEVLIAAHALINGSTIRRADPAEAVTYVHFLLEDHQIVRSNGVLTESFYPSALSLSGLDRAARVELSRLFPDLVSLTTAYPKTARPVLRRTEARLIA